MVACLPSKEKEWFESSHPDMEGEEGIWSRNTLSAFCFYGCRGRYPYRSRELAEILGLFLNQRAGHYGIKKRGDLKKSPRLRFRMGLNQRPPD